MEQHQFVVVAAMKCRACGAVLLTDSGMRRHAERCSLQEPVDKDQLSLLDMIDTGGRPDEADAEEIHGEGM